MENKKGLTLIEVIVTIAIIGIISIPIFTIFNSGLNNIVKAGHRTDSVVDIQKEIDNLIYNPSLFVDDDNDSIDDNNPNIKVISNSTIKIPEISDKDIEGRTIIVYTKDKYGNEITIETFVPH